MYGRQRCSCVADTGRSCTADRSGHCRDGWCPGETEAGTQFDSSRLIAYHSMCICVRAYVRGVRACVSSLRAWHARARARARARVCVCVCVCVCVRVINLTYSYAFARVQGSCEMRYHKQSVIIIIIIIIIVHNL